MQTRVDGVAANIQMIHTRLDSMTTSSNEHFNRNKLTQVSTEATLDTFMARLDALHNTIRGSQKDYHGRGRHVPRHSSNDSFAKIKFKIPPYNGKYDPAAYLD
jgi:hypothetical protein